MISLHPLSDNKNAAFAYDFIFAGLGASASLLLLELHRRNLPNQANILLVDPETKTRNDKTFCFWADRDEPIAQELKHLITHSWSNIMVDDEAVVNLAPIQYNHISSIDLYARIQNLAEIHNWQRLIAPVEDISRDGSGSYIVVNGAQIRGKRIFDSRTPKHHKPVAGETHILQSFIGWIIQSESDIRNDDAFRMMDFNVGQDGYTQFMYVLPFTSKTALVEITRFGAEIIQEKDAALHLKSYIEKHFGKFVQLSIERGCIPMSNAQIENNYVPDITLLGARNYSMKPSTGYAFKNMFYHTRALADSLEKSHNPDTLNLQHEQAFKSRFAFYDSLLLHILHKRPGEGKRIFKQLFKRVELRIILKFLDEKTRIGEDILVFSKLPWTPFILALFHKIIHYSWFRPVVLSIFTVILFFSGNETPAQKMLGYGALLFGLIAVGLPHGAVDHLLETGKWEAKKNTRFMMNYLLKAALMGLVWFLFPSLALLIFLAYSAWHFGQSDGKQWNLSPVLSILWGVSVLSYILGTHFHETNTIMATISNLTLPVPVPVFAMLPWFIWTLIRQKTAMAITIAWIMLSSQIPLIMAFGIYFIGQHSLTSWKHITDHLKQSHRRIWLESLPFHAGAWILLFLFYFFWPAAANGFADNINRWGIFFIFIACISLPHVISMNHLYSARSMTPKKDN